MKIKKLHKDGKRWFWHYDDDDERNYSYFTNDAGQGIFRQKNIRETNDANECDVEQLVGTAQFSLSGYSLSGARSKLNRHDWNEYLH